MIKNIFKESRYLMKGNKFNLFKFQLSYIGWFALGLTPIFLFWYSLPYFSGIRELYFIFSMLLSCIWYLWFFSYFYQGLTIFYLKISKTTIEDNEEVIEC
ncbi:MAG: hypothetical protein ACRC57_10500 [Sarcina sp.]